MSPDRNAKTPIAIPTTQGPLAGWLHPARTAGDAALLICNPFGYEALCAHRSMRVLAELAALAGIAALRFDYRGTGDSADTRPGTDETAAWRANIVDAASWLRATTGCSRLFLAGLRLGATLARQAVEEISGVTGLVAIEPVVSGRRYLRELGALQGSFGASIADFLESERQDQVLGFPLGPATRASLAAIDLTQDRSSPPRRVLVFERSHMRSADKWIQAQQSESCRVDRVETEEYEAMMLDPHKAQVPQQLIERTLTWIGSEATADCGPMPPQTAYGKQQDTGESVALIHPERGTWGVLTQSDPAQQPHERLGVILLNAGATHHVGPNRLYVRWARSWADSGITTLRLDISGIGESPARTPDADNTVYPRNALQDVHAAVQFMRKQLNVSQVHLMGLCSGAFHALQAAADGAQVDGIVMINPLTFFWNYDSAMPSEELALAKQVMLSRSTGMGASRLRQIVSNPEKLVRAASFAVRRGRQLISHPLTLMGRLLRIPTRNDLGATLLGLVRRNVRIQFLFSESDPGRELLRTQGAPFTTGLINRGGISIAVIPGADHTFTLLRHQAELTRLLAQYIESLTERSLVTESLVNAG